MDLLKKIFLLTLFLFPLGEIIRINFGYDLAIKPLDAAVGILTLLWLLIKVFKGRKIEQEKIALSIILFVASGLFSLITTDLQLTASEFLVSFSYLIRWVAYAGIFFVISDFNKNFKKKISSLLIIVGSLIIGLGYFQYFFFPSLKNLFYLGWDEHMYRMFSVFLDPNFAGAFFVLFFLFLLNVFIKKKTIVMGTLLILTLGAIFLTFSRSALIMLIVSSSVFLTLVNKKIWIVFLLGVIFLALLLSSRYSNIENINLFRIVSAEARLETARNAILMIKDHPVFGTGFNDYRYAQLRYGFRNDKSSIVSHADSSPDNSFLFVLATSGSVGFILFAFMWFNLLRYHIKSDPLLLSSVIGVFVNSLFINSLFYSFIAVWLWIIIAVRENN